MKLSGATMLRAQDRECKIFAMRRTAKTDPFLAQQVVGRNKVVRK